MSKIRIIFFTIGLILIINAGYDFFTKFSLLITAKQYKAKIQDISIGGPEENDVLDANKIYIDGIKQNGRVEYKNEKNETVSAYSSDGWGLVLNWILRIQDVDIAFDKNDLRKGRVYTVSVWILPVFLSLLGSFIMLISNPFKTKNLNQNNQKLYQNNYVYPDDFQRTLAKTNMVKKQNTIELNNPVPVILTPDGKNEFDGMHIKFKVPSNWVHGPKVTTFDKTVLESFSFTINGSDFATENAKNIASTWVTIIVYEKIIDSFEKYCKSIKIVKKKNKQIENINGIEVFHVSAEMMVGLVKHELYSFVKNNRTVQLSYTYNLGGITPKGEIEEIIKEMVVKYV